MIDLGISPIGMLSIQQQAINCPSIVSAPWYLTDTVQLSDLICAYQAIGVPSKEVSQVNLVNPGTYDLVELSTAHGWNTNDGWTYDGSGDQRFDTGVAPVPLQEWSFLIRVDGFTDAIFIQRLFGSFTNAGGIHRTWMAVRLDDEDPLNDDVHFYNGSNNALLYEPYTFYGGVLGMNTTHGFVDGVKSSITFPNTGSIVSPYSIWLSSSNALGSPGAYSRETGTTKLFMIANRHLVDQEMIDISNQMAVVN